MSALIGRSWLLFAIGPLLYGSTLTVGPSGQYQRPCQAFAAAASGDTILIDAAGSYDGDVCVIHPDNLLIRGVNGRPKIDAAGNNAEGKAIWVFRNGDITVENMELSGAAVWDRNGAAIRMEGPNLTLRRVYFHDNEDGILVNDNPDSNILIEYSEFDRNGDGVGQAHNIYVNQCRRLSVRFSTFTRAKAGHLLKSRAAENWIYCNRFLTEDADSSYKASFPNGGLVVAVGNVVQQGLFTGNTNMMDYLSEGEIPGRKNQLYVAYNTFSNERPPEPDGSMVNFILAPTSGNYSGVIANNIFAGPGVIAAPEALSRLEVHDNLLQQDPLFLAPGAFNYRLQDNSPAAGLAGALPDSLFDFLNPRWQIQEPECGQPRPQAFPAAVGAFEIGLASLNISSPCTVAWDLFQPQITFSQPKVTVAGQQSVRLSLDGIAPDGGIDIALQYAHPDWVQGPDHVTVPAGASSVLFNIQVSLPPVTLNTIVTAVYRGRGNDAPLSIIVPVVPKPGSIDLSMQVMLGGSKTTTNTVSLTSPAQAGGLVVNLRSSRPDLVTLPATLSFPAGSSEALFTIDTKAVNASTPVTITAEQGGSQATALLTIEPVALTGFLLPARTLIAPGTHVLTVLLTGPAPAGGIPVQLSTDSPGSVSLPSQVLVPEGKAQVSFNAQLGYAGTPTPVQITASWGGYSKTAQVQAAPASITALTLGASTMTGGTSSGSNRVALNGAVPVDGPVSVQLASSDPGVVRVPSSVQVQPGLAVATFQVVTTAVTTAGTVNINAWLPGSDGQAKTAGLTIKP